MDVNSNKFCLNIGNVYWNLFVNIVIFVFIKLIFRL